MKFCVDHVDIFHMSAAMGNDKCTEMQLKIQDSRHPWVFISTPNVGRRCLNLIAANDVVITQKFWVFSEQRQAFAISCPARAKPITTDMVTEHRSW